MSIFQAVLLGLLQGVAEFLPISSSGHLRIAQNLFGLDDVPLLFDVALHIATLLAVIIYFREKIASLILSLWHLIVPGKRTSEGTTGAPDTDGDALRARNNDLHYIVAIILSTVVTGVIGIFTSTFIEDVNIKLVAAGFLVTAALLLSSSFAERRLSRAPDAETKTTPSYIQALIIGFAQGIGTLPGISRSGSTISASLYCGVPRDVAGEYSFIVSIPAILGAFILELKDLGEVTSTIGAGAVLAGCAVAFASGYLALVALMKLIRVGHLEYFAFYLVPAGILGIIFLK